MKNDMIFFQGVVSSNLKLAWKRAIGYENYKAQIHEFVLKHSTSGNEKSEERISLTRLNEQRMNRVEKTFAPIPELSKVLDEIYRPLKWLVISEAWCGDSAQIVPVLQRITEISMGKIKLRLLYRDENPDLMNEFLTNGTRSVPKLIVLDENYQVIATWGPRPEKAMQLVLACKADLHRASTFKDELHKWYAKDRSNSIELEMASLIHNSMARQELLKLQ